jgi:hypothetical protein
LYVRLEVGKGIKGKARDEYMLLTEYDLFKVKFFWWSNIHEFHFFCFFGSTWIWLLYRVGVGIGIRMRASLSLDNPFGWNLESAFTAGLNRDINEILNSMRCATMGTMMRFCKL